MRLHPTSSLRLAGVAVLMAMTSACGDGGSLPPAPAPAAAPAPLAFGAFPSAVAVIGQAGFNQVAPDGTPGTLSHPRGEPAVTADGRLFVADSGADTLKVFSRYDQNGPSVDHAGVALAGGASTQSGRLVVIDGDNVRIFESANPGAAQIAVAGSAATCTAAGLRVPRSAFLTPTGRLVVADSANNRVLVWNSIASGPLGDADVVLGQRTMITCEANDHDGNGTSDLNPSDSTLSGPESVWSDGNRLVVADTGNHRVLVWDNLPTSSFQPARAVIGQSGFADAQSNMGELNPSNVSLSRPVSVDVNDAGQLAVADEQNNRVLLWNAVPLTHAQPADQLIGKSNFGDGGLSPLSAQTLAEPNGVRFYGRDLIVVDTENSRVLVFRGTAPPVASLPVPATPALPFPTEPAELPGPGVGAY